MRMRPDRILIGEIRAGEALDMLKAWNNRLNIPSENITLITVSKNLNFAK